MNKYIHPRVTWEKEEPISIPVLEGTIGECMAGLVMTTNNVMADEQEELAPEVLHELRYQMNVADAILAELYILTLKSALDFTEIAKRKGLERLRKMVYDPPDNFEETANVIIERYVTYLKQQMN